MITLYGIRNCDTCRKARAWLDGRAIAHRYHDVRVDGLDQKTLQGWIDAVGWETLLNRRGTTWRGLSDAEKAGIDENTAGQLMLANVTLIKRPVIQAGDEVTVGFGDEVRARLEAR
jgi:Spx/MgsR family transcriptional regulator